MSAATVILLSLAYLLVLFGAAFWCERNTKLSELVRNSPYVYALSLAAYCTAWTYYGSVGRAATTGIGFLPIYLGPTLMAPLWYIILKKIILICKEQRLTSIADFISSRYGKRASIGALVTIIAILGVIPYISLQLKAIASSFDVLVKDFSAFGFYPENTPILSDTAFYIACILILFTILFGTRHAETTEQNEGLVAAVTIESVIKLFAFLSAGIFVTWFVFDGFADIFSKAYQIENLRKLFTFSEQTITGTDWLVLTVLSMFAVLLLPRQFHLSVVENTKVEYVDKAIWLFPLYLFIINIFVIPIALGGLMLFQSGSVNPDTFVLSIPLSQGNYVLAMFVFIGGFSAATSMVIVATIALTIMFSNSILMPFLLRAKLIHPKDEYDLQKSLIHFRRLIIACIIMMAYAYYKVVGTKYSLVSIGLISFTAIAQFAPAVIGGLFWKYANYKGAITGLLAGFLIWAYTLPIPNLAENGIIGSHWVDHGLFNYVLLKPYALFGVSGMGTISQAFFWSILINTSLFCAISLLTKQSAIEVAQADIFVDAGKHIQQKTTKPIWKRSADFEGIKVMLYRFLGVEKTDQQLQHYAQTNQIQLNNIEAADSQLIAFSEKLLSGVIGSAAARIVINSSVQEENLSLQEVIHVIDETQQIISYNKQLKQKSEELQKVTNQLQNANKRLTELDQLKDDFITTVTHELRTPITAIKSLSKIIYDEEDLNEHKRNKFLSVIINESDRIARLVSDVLDLEKMETGKAIWNFERINFNNIVEGSIEALKPTIAKKNIQLNLSISIETIWLKADHDRLKQVMLNLLSNAIKFCPNNRGKIDVSLEKNGHYAMLKVKDNGIGISENDQQHIFDRFTQFGELKKTKPTGSGLGLSISKKIIEEHQGKIKVESELDKGSVFLVEIPYI